MTKKLLLMMLLVLPVCVAAQVRTERLLEKRMEVYT